MIVLNAKTNVTVLESLGLSVLGMVIVFIVLVFLMVIIIIMTAIIKKTSGRPATVIGTADSSTVAVSPKEPIFDAPVHDAPAPEATYEAESTQASFAYDETTPAQIYPSVRKYRVIVNGEEYDVDADMCDSDMMSETERGN